MDKYTKRKLQIIEILSAHDKWYKTEELASELRCTEKTIRNDIQTINSYLPKGWEIKTIKGKGIYINKPISASINQIRLLFIKNSLTFRAIMLIQFKEIKTLNELSLTLFIQQQAVYKILDRIEGLLRSYKLKLNRGPLEIVGREFEIRLLCCDVLNSVNSDSTFSKNEWPFDNIPFSELNNIIKTTTEEHRLFLYPNTTNKYMYLLATMIHRLNKEIDLAISEKKLKRIFDSKFFLISTEICDKLEKIFHVKISENERVGFTLAISILPYFSYEEIEKSEFLYLFHNKKTVYYEELYDLVDLLVQNTGLPLHEDEDFLYTFQSQLKRYSLILYTIAEKREPSYSLDRYVKKTYPELFDQVSKALHIWTKKYSYPKSTRESIAKVTLNIQATKHYYKMHKKRILLLTSNGPGVHRYITSKLKKAFGDKIDFLNPNPGDIKTERLNKIELDLIISDFQLEFETIHPYIIIDPILTNRDINQISKFI